MLPVTRTGSGSVPQKAKRPEIIGWSHVASIAQLTLLVLQFTATLWIVAVLSGNAPLPRVVLESLTRVSAQPAPAGHIASVVPGVSTASVAHLYGMGSALLPPGFRTFENILKASKSTKNWHSMGHMYSEYLDPMRLQQAEVNMLEIGLQFGASLNLWFDAFPRGKVYGLEYNQLELKAADGSTAQQRATIFRGDQTNVTLLREISERVRREVGLLDFIVDDGGHSMEQQMTSFTHLMPLVRPGGIYFIEDVQTSYWSRCHHHWNKEKYCYGGGPPGKKNTTMDMVKSFLDVLQADFMEDHPNSDKLGSGTYSVNPSDKLIGSVQCWRNMCALRRKFQDSHF